MKSVLVFGARPNFMKVAPLYRAMTARPEFEPVLVHTGQHFDPAMSQDVITALDLPLPHAHLSVGPGTQAVQIAEVMKRLEPVLEDVKPAFTVVVGDVSSTLAAALTSATLSIPVAHVEAGLRSRDWDMPEERNRVLTDRLSHWLFTPSDDAAENLAAEGIDANRVSFVGNVMIDSLDWVLPRICVDDVLRLHHLEAGCYGLVTLHRPSNVDNAAVMHEVIDALDTIAADVPIVFPVHPRTERRLREFDIRPTSCGLRLLPPLAYDSFVGLLSQAAIVLTDSGGIQEEATALGVACLTLRDNTERPITMTQGTNRLVARNCQAIVEAARDRLAAKAPSSVRPPGWDGKAAHRIADILAG